MVPSNIKGGFYMKKLTKKFTGIAIIAILLMLYPIMTLATESTNENLQIVQTEKEKFIIYLKDLQDKEFSYAISKDQTTNEMNLNYIHSVKDKDNNQVILVDKGIYDVTQGTKAYLWIKQEGKQLETAKEVDFSKAFEKNKIEEVENITKKIKTETISDLLEEEKTDENGVKITVKVGGIKITDSKEAQYFYEMMPATENYATLIEKAEKIKNEYSNMDMYTKIQTAKEFYELYNQLAEKANWQSVENMQIKQPKEATEGSKYVVFIKKVEENKETVDVQFLISTEEQTPSYEKEKKIVQETTKLPITGDNLVLLIAFTIVVIAIIFAFIKMKKSDNKTKESK